MTMVREFLRLPGGDKRLLLRAWGLLVLMRLGTGRIPYVRLKRFAEAGRGSPGPVAPSVDRIVWAVGVADRYVPRGTCLTRALATRRLLGRAGRSARLRLGVARSPGGSLEAHAWVECDGRTVMGALADLVRFEPLEPHPHPSP